MALRVFLKALKASIGAENENLKYQMTYKYECLLAPKTGSFWDVFLRASREVEIQKF